MQSTEKSTRKQRSRLSLTIGHIWQVKGDNGSESKTDANMAIDNEDKPADGKNPTGLLPSPTKINKKQIQKEQRTRMSLMSKQDFDIMFKSAQKTYVTTKTSEITKSVENNTKKKRSLNFEPNEKSTQQNEEAKQINKLNGHANNGKENLSKSTKNPKRVKTQFTENELKRFSFDSDDDNLSLNLNSLNRIKKAVDQVTPDSDKKKNRKTKNKNLNESLKSNTTTCSKNDLSSSSRKSRSPSPVNISFNLDDMLVDTSMDLNSHASDTSSLDYNQCIVIVSSNRTDRALLWSLLVSLNQLSPKNATKDQKLSVFVYDTCKFSSNQVNYELAATNNHNNVDCVESYLINRINEKIDSILVNKLDVKFIKNLRSILAVNNNTNNDESLKKSTTAKRGRRKKNADANTSSASSNADDAVSNETDSCKQSTPSRRLIVSFVSDGYVDADDYEKEFLNLKNEIRHLDYVSLCAYNHHRNAMFFHAYMSHQVNVNFLECCLVKFNSVRSSSTPNRNAPNSYMQIHASSINASFYNSIKCLLLKLLDNIGNCLTQSDDPLIFKENEIGYPSAYANYVHPNVIESVEKSVLTLTDKMNSSLVKNEKETNGQNPTNDQFKANICKQIESMMQQSTKSYSILVNKIISEHSETK